MKPEQKYVFFLGGLDLEILTITEIKNLTIYQVPIFIEIGLDTPLPKNAILIDHHSSDENKKSSLEQVAELLHIELNRWQKLVAANDKGFIPVMESMCATKDEIERICEADFAILVPNAFPSKKQFYFIEKLVFVISPISLKPFTYILRQKLKRMAII